MTARRTRSFISGSDRRRLGWFRLPLLVQMKFQTGAGVFDRSEQTALLDIVPRNDPNPSENLMLAHRLGLVKLVSRRL